MNRTLHHGIAFAIVCANFGMPISGSAAASTEFEFGQECQTVSGWGLRPVDARDEIDWGKGPVVQFLVNELKYTDVKCVIRHECWDNEGTLDAGRIKRYVLDYITAFVKDRRSYFTTVDSPPPIMKRYQTPAGTLDMNPNGLLEEAEAKYVNDVVQILRCIKDAKLKLPVAHSLIDGVYSKGALVACPMGYEQWSRLSRMLADELRSHGLSEVKVIGPESYGYSLSVESGARHQLESPLTFGTPFGPVAFHSNTIEAVAPVESVSDLSHVVGLESRGIWMTGWFAASAPSEELACADAARCLIRDLGYARTTRWFYGCGYVTDKVPGSLVYGEGAVSALGRMFQALWTSVPVGSRVCRITQKKIDDNDSYERRFDCIGFRSSEAEVVLAVNVSQKGEFLATGRLSGQDASIWRSDSASSGFVQIRQGSPIIIPPGSVVLVKWPLARFDSP